MNEPVFSIITPTCGRPLLLKRNIASVRGQTFPDFEHVIVDDAGDPETARLVRGMREPRIVFVSHSSPRGASAAYNTGIEKSRGRHIVFLDDDDEYLPEFLSKVHDRIRNTPPSLGFVLTGFTRVLDGESGERPLYSRIWPLRFPSREDMLLAATSIGNGCGVCVKRECIDRIGTYDESLIVSEDTDFLIKLAGAYDCETVPESLVKIHSHERGKLTDP
jgi:glycosyltransferase involved in cell wall biosynthesis